MQTQPPMWDSHLIGIKFQDIGRTRDESLDYWSMVENQENNHAIIGNDTVGHSRMAMRKIFFIIIILSCISLSSYGHAEDLFDGTSPATTGADNVPYELGTIFTPTVNGTITAVRLYTVSSETGNHTARIWNNSTGNVVGGPYTFCAAGKGWRTHTLPSPITVTAGTAYTVSISTGTDSTRRFARTASAFTSSGSNGRSLTYQANAGVYTTTLGSRPTSTSSSANYFRDISFTPTQTPSGFWASKSCPPAPSTDVTLNPGDNIQAAIDSRGTGASFLLRAGTYQNQGVTLKTGNRLYGELDSECRPTTVLNGGRTLTNFQTSGSIYYVTGQTQEGQRITSSGDPGGRTCMAGYPRCNYPEQVFIDNVPLKAVDSQGAVVAGTFYFDYAADRIYIADNPAGKTVETTLNAQGLNMASNAIVRGIRLEKYAVPYAVVSMNGTTGVNMQFNEIGYSHDYAISNWEVQNLTFSNNRIHHMGRGGGWIGQPNNANLQNGLFEGNEISYNNFEHWDTWDNPKFWQSNGSIARGNCIHHNYGTAIWSDTFNRNLIYERNIVFDNTIFLDARGAVFDFGADGNIVRYNAIGRNLWEGDFTTGDSGDGAGIATEGSAHATVHNNYIEVLADRANGIAFNNYPASGGAGGPAVVTGNSIHDNEITYLGANGRSGINGTTTGTTFNNNLYHVTDLNGGHFQWGWPTLTWAQFRAAGAEANGQIDTNVTALNWSCDMAMPAITQP